MSEKWVSADWLREHRNDPDVVPIDVRTEQEYVSGHLPRARRIDPAAFTLGISTPQAIAQFIGKLEKILSEHGISGSEHVVVYESAFDTRAARVAWVLEYLGHPRVSLLEGSLAALAADWVTEVEPIVPAHFQAKPVSSLLATAHEIATAGGGIQVLDTRRPQEYLGTEIKTGRAGHIPSARHCDYVESRSPDGGFKNAEALRTAFVALGLASDRRVVTYCGGGGRAAHSYYALKRAGFDDVGVYLPSWAEWGARVDLPVETGQPTPSAGTGH